MLVFLTYPLGASLCCRGGVFLHPRCRLLALLGCERFQVDVDEGQGVAIQGLLAFAELAGVALALEAGGDAQDLAGGEQVAVERGVEGERARGIGGAVALAGECQGFATLGGEAFNGDQEFAVGGQGLAAGVADLAVQFGEAASQCLQALALASIVVAVGDVERLLVEGEVELVAAVAFAAGAGDARQGDFAVGKVEGGLGTLVGVG